MIAMRSDIRQLQVDGQHYKTVVHTRFIKAAMSLDVDIQNKMLYLADLGNHSIVKASLDNADKVEHIIKNVQKPEGLAFDWIAGNIYWSSTHPKCKEQNVLLYLFDVLCELSFTAREQLLKIILLALTPLLYILIQLSL